MKKSILLSVILVIAVSFGCKKEDQKLVDQLEGSWEIKSGTQTSADGATNFSEFPINVTPIGNVLTFENCKIKKGDCPGSELSNDGTTTNFTYSTGESGDTFTVTDDSGTQLMTVESISSTNMTITFDEVDDGESFSYIINLDKK